MEINSNYTERGSKLYQQQPEKDSSNSHMARILFKKERRALGQKEMWEITSR